MLFQTKLEIILNLLLIKVGYYSPPHPYPPQDYSYII